MRPWVHLVVLSCAAMSFSACAKPAPVWLCPPAHENGRCLRELFEQPDQWKAARAAIDGIGYADHCLNRQFTDDELRAWFPKLREWRLKFALEVGAVKPWGPTGEKAFAVERPMWDRFQRLGAKLDAIAMDEPLSCVRQDLKKPDDYAVEETATFVALVREHYPDARVGDIEPYPFLPLPDLIRWIDALQRRLAEKGVRGLDFFRLDVDWMCFTAAHKGSWQEVKELERQCRRRGLPFSLVYWSADYPEMKRRGKATDATWLASTLRMGADYAAAGGAPDEIVIESWLDAPAHAVPETGEGTLTRAVLDFTRQRN